MAHALKVNIDSVNELAKKFKDPTVRGQIMDIPKDKGAAAIISQAIGDNFDKGGPGWKPLAIRKGLPLQNTGLLKKSATTVGHKNNIYRVEGKNITWGTNLPYAKIHNEGGTVIAKNAKALFIPLSDKGRRVGPLKEPGLRTGKNKLEYGVDFTFAKSVDVPKREFLVIRPEWRAVLEEWCITKVLGIIKKAGIIK